MITYFLIYFAIAACMFVLLVASSHMDSSMLADAASAMLWPLMIGALFVKLLFIMGIVILLLWKERWR